MERWRDGGEREGRGGVYERGEGERDHCTKGGGMMELSVLHEKGEGWRERGMDGGATGRGIWGAASV